MNKTKLKSYAPQARKDFIAAVTARANQLGLSSNGSGLVVSPASRHGDVTLIEGRDWPAKVYGQRERLVKRMQREGFDQTVEAVAYTWFNRFAALRFMELHDYLEHGYRVLSSLGNDGGATGTPDILLHAVDLAQNQSLPGLKVDEVGRLKLAGNQDGELYRKLLIAQCNALSNAMPFLFEHIDDETELLLPDNLLRTDSVIAKLVSEIPEEDWQEVEVIGWLYQFYISEKKDQVIGKVVKSEDIPAATQLFTPNWIVKYMVQNSVGRLWMMANPATSLKSQWEYYIEPAEQKPEVNSQLDALIQTRMDEDGGSLNPETITVLDPACGSGHILVEAYDLLKGIYLERGYRLRDIPRLILEKNLYGLDIDDRAAQMAGFALLMKARADDRRLLNETPKLNVLSLQESKGLNLDDFAGHLKPFGISRGTLGRLLDTFAHAKTFGSLIQISELLHGDLNAIAAGLDKANHSGDVFARPLAQELMPFVAQAEILAMKFDAVIANPPYMGPKGMNSELKEFARQNFQNGKSDLFAMFIERAYEWSKTFGFNSMITMHSWMFLSSFEAMRESLLSERTIYSMAHLGARAFSEITGEVVQTTVFVIYNRHQRSYRPTFVRLVEGDDQKKKSSLRSGSNRYTGALQDDFTKIPGSPIAYWAGQSVFKAFSGLRIFNISISDGQNITADNDKYVRFWWEVDFSTCGRDQKWLTYCKGGSFRKWFGNLENVIDWSESARGHYRSSDRCRIIPDYLWYKEGVTWSRVASKDSPNGFRLLPKDSTFDKVGSSIFIENKGDLNLCLGLLNSSVASYFIPMLNPSIDLQVRDVRNIPYIKDKLNFDRIEKNVLKAIHLSRVDWDCLEVSTSFVEPLTRHKASYARISESHEKWRLMCEMAVDELHRIEEENNAEFIQAYGLSDVVSSEVPRSQITLCHPIREEDAQRLISFIIGCVMGRYSLDDPGLIYAHSGNVGFDETRYKTFPVDSDGIVPITDELWFEDDAANRVREFVRVVWGTDSLEENMTWLAESLGKKDSETPDEAIRRYLSDKFFKDHLQTYKKRPIYWLFSSGKQSAFQALVYLHRYHEGTLARMRAEYVVPLTGKIQSRIEMLEKDVESASSTAARNKINKEIEKLRKKHVELLAYDEKLRHYADMRIKLDLDEGVKVNYGKFGDLLDSVKAITGGSDD